ncbi:MAG: c-type cytochrome [Gaiellaceae bacterium]
MLVVSAATCAVTGCGGQHSTRSAQLRAGREIYARSCAGCHTLNGRESGAPGGDLVNTNLSLGDLASFARAMPVRPPLTVAQSNAVARYVHAVARYVHAAARPSPQLTRYSLVVPGP